MIWKDFARSAAKAMAANALHYSGVQGLLSRAARVAVGGRRVLILSYHRIVEDFESESRRAIPGLLLSRDTFVRHLDELHRAGFRIVPLAEATEVVSGRREARQDMAVLTFDDGYRDVWAHAFPVLRQRGLSATVYLASSFVGSGGRFPHDRLHHLLQLQLGRNKFCPRNVVADEGLASRAAFAVERLISGQPADALSAIIARLEKGLGAEADPTPPTGEVLSWEMVQEMSAAGIEFGAHTVNHVVLTHESEEAIDREIAASKAEIESRLGKRVVDFAYPNGYYDRRVVAALVRHGFHSAVTTEDLPNRVGGDLFRLKRKTLWENFSRGPFGYSSSLTSCHLDDVFGILSLTHPVIGERAPAPPAPSEGARATGP
jgi:peptidoglycan/xylan/chitin deacetylase (PgdA/CDA1 family)